MAASGTFGFGREYANLIDIQRLGAIVSKGTTLRPRAGNKTPRIAETPAGMLNSIGLQNPGVRRVIREFAPVWETWKVPVIVNIAGDSVEEYAKVAGLLDEVPGVAGLELNISCPNVAAGGMAFGVDPLLAAEVTRAVRSATSLPLIVKLSPNAHDIVAVACAVVEAGANAVSLINTLVGMAIDVEARRPVLGNVVGGLSGPAVKPVALRMVYQVAGAVGVPVIGIGGISTARDALEFFMAGASAVQVGTANFVNPQAMIGIIDGLTSWMGSHGVEDLREVIGVARPLVQPT
ncbi:MAG: dihydroorotate dehydrogenase [Chloroflexi bacterium]|nr:dihydroorotate dehydrogenase [Chloroflexota bacterium]